MANISNVEWWKAQEIPLTETVFTKVRKYFHKELPSASLKSCVYIIRLSPPFSVVYGQNCEVESPLIYVGSGNLIKRWGSHRKWLKDLGIALPGARYELWFCQPTRKGPGAATSYKDVEADILQWFNHNRTVEYLPLANKKLEKPKNQNSYPDNFYNKIVGLDTRYHWAIYPTRNPISNMYYKGGKSMPNVK